MFIYMVYIYIYI